MIRLPTLPKQVPAPRAGVFVLEPIRQDGSGVSYRAWSPGENGTVALWVDALRVSDDPARAERLARQAVALERVRHPNLAEVVRVDDLGDRLAVVERGVGGSAVEPGEPRRPGPSEVRRGIGVGLQAARGLSALHSLGLIHGDLRSDDLSVRGDGLVRLTGLGRVAPPPERFGDAGSILMPDPEAALRDRQAMGRILFELVTGSPVDPSTDPGDLPPAESINPRVPAGLSGVIRRLSAAEGSGGYSTIGEAVTDLERLAGAPKSGAFLPREELVEAYRACASDYVDTPTVRLRRAVLLGSYGGTSGLALLGLFVGLSSLAIGLIGLMAMTAGCSFVVGGVRRGGPVFDRVRRFVLGGRARDLATVGAAVGLAVVGLWASGLLGVALALGIVSAILAGLQEAFIDQPIDEERRDAIDRAVDLLKDLRHHGLREEGVAGFAVDHGGARWGPIFLELFGFDAYRKALARRRVPAEERLVRVELSGRLERFPPGWRGSMSPQAPSPGLRPPSPPRAGERVGVRGLATQVEIALIAGIDARLKARRDDRDRALLTPLVERRLIAEGVYELTARRRSWRIVPAVLARLRAFEIEKTFEFGTGGPIPEGGENLASLMAGAIRDPELVLIESETESRADRLRRRALAVLDAATGPRARLLAGLAMLVGVLAWAHQNQLIRGEDVREVIEASRSIDDPSELVEALDARRLRIQQQAGQAEALRVEGVPGPVSRLFLGPGAGLAAVILLGSCLFRGRWVALGAILASGLALVLIDLGRSLS